MVTGFGVIIFGMIEIVKRLLYRHIQVFFVAIFQNYINM